MTQTETAMLQLLVLVLTTKVTKHLLHPPIYCDVGLWPDIISDALRIEIVKRGSAKVQYNEGPFEVTERSQTKMDKGVNRSLTKEWFYRQMENGERILRSWMTYSPVHKCLYCFCWSLFHERGSTSQDTLSSFVKKGFRNWWKINPKIAEHKNSPEHLRTFEQWKELEMRMNCGLTIDKLQQEQICVEVRKWTNILERIPDAVVFLAKQNLAFRGHREAIDGDVNPGNFLELIK